MIRRVAKLTVRVATKPTRMVANSIVGEFIIGGVSYTVIGNGMIAGGGMLLVFGALMWIASLPITMIGVMLEWIASLLQYLVGPGFAHPGSIAI